MKSLVTDDPAGHDALRSEPKVQPKETTIMMTSEVVLSHFTC
jgi:hypothetical protein